MESGTEGEMLSDASIVTIVTGCVTVATMIGGVITLWLKLKYGVANVGEKIDANTKITQDATTAATDNAKEAANAAITAKDAAEKINKKLNGGIEEAIRHGIHPVQVTLEAHVKKDAEDIGDIKKKFEVLSEYVHQRNHDVLDALQGHGLKMDLILKTIGANKKES
jgi:hypothetical protein